MIVAGLELKHLTKRLEIGDKIEISGDGGSGFTGRIIDLLNPSKVVEVKNSSFFVMLMKLELKLQAADAGITNT